MNNKQKLNKCCLLWVKNQNAFIKNDKQPEKNYHNIVIICYFLHLAFYVNAYCGVHCQYSANGDTRTSADSLMMVPKCVSYLANIPLCGKNFLTFRINVCFCKEMFITLVC